MGTKRTTFVRRLLLAVLAVGFVVFGVVPQLSYASEIESSSIGIGTVDEPLDCEDGEVEKDGECVPVGCVAPQVPVGPDGKCDDPCAPGEIRTDAGACQKPELVDCRDGTQAPTQEQCPTPPTTTPCPDGSAFCGQVRSCPTDTPLPPGATCDDPGPTTTTAPPVRPAPAPIGDRGTFGRPAVVEGSGGERPAPAPVVPDSLARTGLNEWLAVIGVLLVAMGVALVRSVADVDHTPATASVSTLSVTSQKNHAQNRMVRAVVAVALLFVLAVWAAPPASAETPDGGVGGGAGRETAPGQVKKAPEPMCPEGQLPDNFGGCFVPMCPDGSEIPSDGNCPPPQCEEGVEICETRSCPVDSPLPPGALCDEDGGSLSSSPDPPAAQPVVTTVAAAERGGATLGSAVQGSVFGRPAEVLGVVIDAAPADRARADLPAVAATGTESTTLAALGFAFVLVGAALLHATRQRPAI